MELHRDLELCKENGNTFSIFSGTKEQPEVPVTAMQYPRTPLTDVKNKNNQGTAGLHGSSRKFSIDSCARQDVLNHNRNETPRRQSKAKSRKSCFAVFQISENLDSCENAARGITLPRAKEEESENLTLQSQKLLGDVCEGEQVMKSKTGESPCKAFTLTPLKSGISFDAPHELDLGCELDVTFGSALVDRTEQNYVPGQDFGCDNSGSDEDAAVVPVNNGISPVLPENGNSLIASELAPEPMISLADSETDNTVDTVVKEFAIDLTKRLHALTSNSEVNLYSLSHDHPYYSASTVNRSDHSQYEVARNVSPSPACESTLDSTQISEDVPHFQEQQFSTPKPTHDASLCLDFVTPLVSSPLDLMSISNSSFREELQKTELADMIQSYLLNISTSKELLFSTEPNVNLPPLTEYYDQDQRELQSYLSNNLLDSITDIPEIPAACVFTEQDSGNMEVHYENCKKICHLESEDDETKMETDGCVNIVRSDYITFITSRKSVNSPASSLQDRENQTSFIMESDVNEGTSIVTLSHNILSSATAEKNGSLVCTQTDVSVETSRYQEAFSTESFTCETGADAATMTDRITVNLDAAALNDTILGISSNSTDDRPVFVDCPMNISLPAIRIVSAEDNIFLPRSSYEADKTNAATTTSVLQQADVSVLTDPHICEIDVTNAATNTSVLLQSNALVLTDPEIYEIDVTNVATNTSVLQQADVSVLTDPHICEIDVTNAATNTSVLQQVDVSVLTDPHQHGLVNTSMMTEVFMTTVCSGIDVSMVTDCVDMHNTSIMAVPESQTQETMTEKVLLVDTESSMTPLRLGKQGKRLTAEEVRRQHPRILANQLEVLMASNQRLEKEVGVVTQDRDRLKSVLTESRSKLATADKLLSEEKERQAGVISVIEQCHRKALESLETCLKDKQNRIAQLESELGDVRQKSEKTQEDLKSCNWELQEKCSNLEKLNQEAQQHFTLEIGKLQSEENSYHHAFLASQQVIKELQAEKEEFGLLLEDIEHSISLKSQLQESVHLVVTKSQKSVRDHVNMYERLVKENQTIHQQYTSMQTDLEVALSENKDVHEDMQNINDILNRSNENYAMLKEMYQGVQQDLEKSQAEVVELNSKIEFGFRVVQDLMKTKADMTEELSRRQEEQHLLDKNFRSATEEIKKLQQQLEHERQISAKNHDKYETTIAACETSKSMLELTVENLRTTLDSWEVDRAVQEQETNAYIEVIAGQKTKLEELNKELQVLRQVKAITQPERDRLQELKNANQFLEAEKQLYLDAVTDYRTRLEAEMELAASNNELIKALRSNNSELKQSNDQMLSDIQVYESYLSVKTVDMDMSCTAMENLQERMESVLATMQQKFKLEVTQGSKDKFATPKTPSSSFHDGTSSVAHNLSAVKVQQPQPPSNLSISNQGMSELNTFVCFEIFSDRTERPKQKQSNLHYGALQPKYSAEAEALLSPHSHSFSVPFQANVPSQISRTLTDIKKPLISPSPFEEGETIPKTLMKCNRPKTSARKDISKLYSQQEQVLSTSGFAKICSIPSTMDRTLENLNRVKADNSRSADLMNSSLNNSSQDLESESMLAKVKMIDRLFSLVVTATDMSERASELTIIDLKDEIVLLKEKLRYQCCQTSDLESDIKQKSAELVAASSQIKDLNTRVGGMTRSLLKYQDQHYEITRLEGDKADLNRTVRSLREEVSSLSTQLEEMIQKVDSAKSGEKSDASSLREIVSLKKKNHELIMRLFDERDKNKEVGEKAMRRMKILESNWQKAEAEVCRFDELVENIRETCVRSQAQSTHPAILKVVRLIDGVEKQPTTETVNRTPHKSTT